MHQHLRHNARLPFTVLCNFLDFPCYLLAFCPHISLSIVMQCRFHQFMWLRLCCFAYTLYSQIKNRKWISRNVNHTPFWINLQILKEYDKLAGTLKQVQIVKNLKIEPSTLRLILKKQNEIERRITESVTQMKQRLNWKFVQLENILK